MRTHHTPGKKNIERKGKVKKRIHNGMDRAMHRLRLIGAAEKNYLKSDRPFLMESSWERVIRGNPILPFVIERDIFEEITVISKG